MEAEKPIAIRDFSSDASLECGKQQDHSVHVAVNLDESLDPTNQCKSVPDVLREAAKLAANLLFLLEREVKALGHGAENVLPKLRNAIANTTENNMKTTIKLSPAEIQSGSSRVQWAEGLVLQLPVTHDGRNSWLLNYGVSEQANQIRIDRMKKSEEEKYVPTPLFWNDETKCFGSVPPPASECNAAITTENQPNEQNAVSSLPPQSAPSPEGLWQVLQNVRNSLERINNDESAIVDTLWYSDHETLFDYIDAALEIAPREVKP